MINIIKHNSLLRNILNEKIFLNKRSQDLEKYYRLNGAICICKTEKFLEAKSFFLKENIFAYVMNRESSVDIDEEIDFVIAKSLIHTSNAIAIFD